MKASAVKFDLGNLQLEIEGMLENLKGDSDALAQLHELLAEALEKCSQAMTESQPSTSKSKERRIPDD